ncbi:ABC transporter substrate-binding protein [Fundidesulfovibrio agrisoli]|uniref:ABC transporter substrate-binding protein n=1 Tax=Fundidesulfovibrio agrisoli TaxID=2922717 RepID=UPI001FAB4C8C|nr:ABC transporter substrate-binding protein [Fundidesulfovibrio agrisoli]
MRFVLACAIALFCILPGPARAGDSPRVVSLYAAHAENLALMGAAGVLVGVNEPMGNLPVLSARDGAEAIAALKPDLVLARPMHRTMQPGLIEQLERLGVKVACLQPASPSELEPYWLELGRLTGHEAQARGMAEAFRRELAALEAVVAKVPEGERKRVYFESIHRQMKTVSPGSMAAFVLERAGGINAAPDAEPVSGSNIALFGLERLVAEGDRVDVYLAQKGPMNPVSVEEIAATPGLSGLKAVREGRVYLVDEALTSRPTPRLAQGARQVAMLLYPQLFGTDGVAK